MNELVEVRSALVWGKRHEISKLLPLTKIKHSRLKNDPFCLFACMFKHLLAGWLRLYTAAILLGVRNQERILMNNTNITLRLKNNCHGS